MGNIYMGNSYIGIYNIFILYIINKELNLLIIIKQDYFLFTGFVPAASENCPLHKPS